MTHVAILPAALTALALTACGMAGAATIAGGSPLAQSPQPLTCSLLVQDRQGTVSVEGQIAATRTIAGSYALRIIQRNAGGSSQISQGGDFEARAGQRLTLGEASFNGRLSDLAAALTVEIDGRAVDCPTTVRG